MYVRHQRGVTPRIVAPTLLAATLATVMGSLPARADQTLDQQLEQPSEQPTSSMGLWDVTLGMGLGYGPRFDGAKRYHFEPLPFGLVNYGRQASLGPDGLGANVIATNHFKMGVVAAYGGGRDQDDDPHLAGLGNIQSSIKVGGYVAYRWEGLEIRAQARQSVTHSDNGLDASVGASYTFHPAAGWTLKAGPQVSFADDAYMRRYFGVSYGQSRASGLAPYRTSGGPKDIAFGLNGTYQMTQHWMLFGIMRVSELVDHAADSPIVQDKEQVFSGMGLAYHF